MEKKFKRSLASLEGVFQFIRQCQSQYRLDDSLVFTLDLVIEELFTNMVKYQKENPNEISIDLMRDDDKLTIILTDYDAHPFDIHQARSYDHTKSLKERQVGGVGIHLVKKMMDRIDYEYEDGQSRIKLIKYLEESHVRHKES